VLTVSTSLVVMVIEVDLGSMDADIGDRPAGRDDFLAKLERRRNPHRLDGGIDAASAGQFHDGLDGMAVAAVDRRGGAEALGDRQALIIQVDHDDLGRREELRGQQSG
jgi:hypothetical protein